MTLMLTSESGEPVGARCCAFQGDAGLDIAGEIKRCCGTVGVWGGGKGRETEGESRGRRGEGGGERKWREGGRVGAGAA